MQYMPSLNFQVGCILYSAGLGFSLGIIYDLFRMLFYLLTGSDKKLVNLRDIIYSIVCLAATFLFLLVMCDGQILVYVFIAEAVGAYIYFRTLSRQIFSPVRKVIVIIRRFFARIKRFLSEIKTKITEEENKELVGTHQKVLVVEKGSKGGFIAKTDSYIPVIVSDAKLGTFVDVIITEATATYLKSELYEE